MKHIIFLALLVGFGLVSASVFAHTTWSNLQMVWDQWPLALQWAGVLGVWILWIIGALVPSMAVAGYGPFQRA